MFEYIRTHQKLMQILLAIVIVPSFVFVGVSGYQSFDDSATAVAKIDGKTLSQQDWEAAQRRQLDNLRQRMGQQYDQKLFDTPEFKQNILETLVAERSINAEVIRSHMTIGDAALQKYILGQGLTKADGSFDMERYQALLAAQGMTPQMYEARVRQELAFQQLTSGIESSGFAPRTVSKMISDIGAQERDVQELVLPISEFLPQVKVTDEMVKAFYDKNPKLFELPEQAKIEYLLLNADAVAAQVTVSDEEVAAYYKSNAARFTAPETRRASHILVAVNKDATAAQKAAAKAKADAIAAEVRKAPATFAAVAKAKSEDPASAELGGDLNVIEKGALPKAVEDAIFALKQGDISTPVESEFGYHVLTVTELKAATTKPLDEVKGDIAADLKKQKAAKKYSEMAEAFSNTVYEQADSLKPAADKTGLKIESAAGLSRTPSPMLGAAPFNNAKFLTALFSEDSLKNKRNTEAVEIAPSTLIAGRIVEYKPASKRPLAEVDAAIRQRVTMEEALSMARKAGEAKLAAAKKDGNTEGFGEVKSISRSKVEGINQAAALAVLKADVSKLPAYVGVDLPGQGYGLYRIGKVHQPAQQDEARRKAEQEQIGNIISQQEMYGYVESLKAKAKVKMLRPSLTAKTEEAK
ncbi:SurA N-terminal domain-containing protein [Massilia sp. SM-13]|uniref:SurA N-terminal domain-containing protein n=1 Tax=Pseudoduganella rhizocola TaxID=3382643 RepID=UPI0038B575B7